MRIITGEKRGKKLLSLQDSSVRPTTDKVKESLFNILQFRIEGRRFLDLFAGTGQVGIEALSRGAKSATFVDNSRQALSVIKKNVELSGYEGRSKLVSSDFSVFLKGTSDVFDVAFIDPPYHKDFYDESIEQAAGCMAETGIMIVEHPSDVELKESYGDFVKIKSYRYGKIYLTSYESGKGQ